MSRHQAIKLSRHRDHSRLLIRTLATSLVVSEKVVTTKSKAKVLVPYFEKLVTKAKQQNLAGLRHLKRELDTEVAIKKMFEDLAVRSAKRSGGYTRSKSAGWRQGDNSPLVEVSLTDPKPVAKPKLTNAKTMNIKAGATK